MRVKDRFGIEFGRGDKVLYTTNARESGISFGLVEDIYAVQRLTYNGKTITDVKVRLRAIKDDGSLMMQTRGFIDPLTNEWRREDTHKPLRASILDYSDHKFVLYN